MAFLFTVETGAGVAGANAAIDLSFAHDYHETHGQLTAWDGTALATAITAVDTPTDVLTVGTHAFKTGDGPVRMTGTPPAPLVAGVDYWVIVASSTTIKLAASHALALAGTAINVTDGGAGPGLSHPDFGKQRTAIVLGTDHLEQLYAARAIGERSSADQGLAWPRVGAYLHDKLLTGVPELWKRAAAEYALRARSAPLAPDHAAVVTESRSKGGVSRSVSYGEPGGLLAFPAADRWLEPLLRSVRAVRH